MINPSFKELSKISKSRYEICVMAMKRAKLLTQGSELLTDSKSHTPVTQALDEIMAGSVRKKGE